MKKKNIQAGILIIASAIIWGITIIGVSLKLKGTDCYGEIQTILVLGVVMHMILIWTPLGILAKKLKKENREV